MQMTHLKTPHPLRSLQLQHILTTVQFQLSLYCEVCHKKNQAFKFLVKQNQLLLPSQKICQSLK